jgi:UDP:flavonoid glycosyltransferase YjiC (YdhE family)
MGSMGKHGLVYDADKLLSAIHKAVVSYGMKAVVQWPEDSNVWSNEWSNGDGTFVRVVRDVSYADVFPKCACVVHHGGIGTTSECLRMYMCFVLRGCLCV